MLSYCSILVVKLASLLNFSTTLSHFKVHFSVFLIFESCSRFITSSLVGIDDLFINIYYKDKGFCIFLKKSKSIKKRKKKAIKMKIY